MSWPAANVPYVASAWTLAFFGLGSMSIRSRKSSATSYGDLTQQFDFEDRVGR